MRSKPIALFFNSVTTAPGTSAEPASHLAARPPLRIGLMLDDWTVPAWVAKVVSDIQNSGFAAVQLVILNKNTDPPKPPVWKRLLTLNVSPQARKGALFFLYQQLDRRLFPNRIDAFKPADLRPLTTGADVIEVIPEKKKWTDRFKLADIEAIRKYDLDVALRFGFRIIRGDILNTARYGVWSYHHGDNLVYRGTPSLFWEMAEEHPVSGVVLQILTDALDGGKVIYRSQGATTLESLNRQRNATYWKASQFVARRLKDLHTRGWDYIQNLPTYTEKPEQLGKIYHQPTNADMLRFFARNLVVHNGWRQVRQRSFVDCWSLAWRRQPAGAILNGDTNGFQYLRPHADRYYADPCTITVNGRTWVFFEDFRYQEDRGLISCAELTPSGPGEVRTVLDRPYHLSYPFVFEHNGEVYMAPETSEARGIELFRAKRFPDEWEFHRKLIDGPYVDPTLFKHDGLWWMFANGRVEGTLALDELFLFHAESPFGPWTPHPNNPVVSDIRKARPAGPVFNRGGALIRPAQDCSRTYGWAVSFQKIVKLTTDEYEEESVGRIEPPIEKGNVGIHTYTASGGFEILDVKRDAWRTTSRRPRKSA